MLAGSLPIGVDDPFHADDAHVVCKARRIDCEFSRKDTGTAHSSICTARDRKKGLKKVHIEYGK
jgi:hypothetical protein